MKDWGEVSELFAEIHKKALSKKLENESEAQTRFDLIDRIIKEILQYNYGQISVEKFSEGTKTGYIDYLLIVGDYRIIIEAKKVGAAFPSPTRRKKLKLTGLVLGQGEIANAINQAEDYAKSKDADIVMVTNGNCWCYYPLTTQSRNSIYASILFPFEKIEDAEVLFNFFMAGNVENHSLKQITTENDIVLNNKLNTIVDNSDYRLGRNNIADHIMKGIDYAILSENLLEDEDILNKCYVSTDSRVKFDSTLQMHLTQYKPKLVQPAKKIRRNQTKDDIAKNLDKSIPGINNPVTLLIGSVGSGKSTYLKHFELVKSKGLLEEKNAHWIYIDFEKLGKDGNARNFIYNALNEYLLKDKPKNETTFEDTIKPAYKEEIKSLAKGPYALLAKNKEKFEEKIIELIDKDFRDVEPYVNKVFRYLASKKLCVLVIDNVDLYEDDVLETKVFSESISISKSIKCSTIVSLRDTTFIKHRNNSIFNAYELKKFWVNPPSFKEVLSKRLNYAKFLLKGESAEIELNNNIKLSVDDLSVFFSIVQKSVLNEYNGKLIEYLSDRNPRKGIHLIQNFLTSGHIQADKAIRNYIEGDANFVFPFHEVFKGSILGQWKYYKENRAEAINIFDANLGAQSLQLTRLYILRLLQARSKMGISDVLTSDIYKTISKIGVTHESIDKVLLILKNNSLIHTNDEKANDPSYNITLCGGYYIGSLSHLMIYIESILMDSNIYEEEVFDNLADITQEIEYERDLLIRMRKRKDRAIKFLDYLKSTEDKVLHIAELKDLKILDSIINDINNEFDKAISKISYRQSLTS